MPYLQREGDVFVLFLGNEGDVDNQNRFHPDWVKEFHARLDEVEAHEGPAALVTAATGKFFSNGLDTDWLFANMDQISGYLDSVHTIFSRILTFPMTTVAAMQGHAFGAGAMLASSHDFRLMRADRGYYSLPEVTLNMPFTVGMNALVPARMPAQTALEAMTTGRRFSGPDAVAAGIAEATATEDDLLVDAVKRAAAATASHGPNLGLIKRRLHQPILDALAVETASYELFAK